MLDSENDASNARLNQRVDTRGRATVRTTGLECYICGCTCNGLFGCSNGSNFRMRLASALVPAFGNDAIALGDNTSNPRIWMRCFQAAFGERQGPRHRESIKFSEHHVTRKRSSLTSPLLCNTPTPHAPVELQRNTSLFALTKPSRALNCWFFATVWRTVAVDA